MLGWLISDRNQAQVFAVDGRDCGGSVGVMSGGLERWSLGELGGGVWGELVVCGAGNFEVEEDGFCEWRFGCLGWFWVDAGR